MPKSYFYAVRVGRAGPFVYSSWEDCERATKGFPSAEHKKFAHYADAERWSLCPPESRRDTRPLYARASLVSASSLLSPAHTPSKASTSASVHVQANEVISLLSSDVEDQKAPLHDDIIELLSDSEIEQDELEFAAPPAQPVDHHPARRGLSAEQQHIFDLVVQHHKSVFFTGSAGTGKSFLLRSIIEALPPHGNGTAVTATTGIAAVNIGGSTLHSWAGIRLGKEDARVLVQKITGFARKRWLNTHTLIVDEISMCDGSLLDKLDYIGRDIRPDKELPFGGLQLVFCGDFFQLPPVPDQLDDVKVPIAFAFEARCWKEALPHCFTLTHVFRQKEQEFVDILNEARLGNLGPSAIEKFRKLARPLAFSDGIEATQLFPKRDQVKSANDRKLKLLRTPPHTFVARDFPGTDNKGNPILPTEATKKLDRNVLAPASVTLKVGAQVMLIMNLEGGLLVNGSQGIVAGFQTPLEARDHGFQIARADEPEARGTDPGRRRPKQSLSLGKLNPTELANCKWPVVKFKNGMSVLVEPAQFCVANVLGKTEAQRDQIPLILAWALSIHKSQGQTLERVKVDLSETFEKGQAYVALSRATTLEGLQVLGFSPEKVVAHVRVIEWARSLKMLGVAPAVSKSSEPEDDSIYWADGEDEVLFRSYEGPY